MRRFTSFIVALFAILHTSVAQVEPADSMMLAELDSLLARIDSIQMVSAQQPKQNKLMAWLSKILSTSDKRLNRPFDKGYYIGPMYSVTNKLSLYATLTGNYTWDRSDSTLRRSNVDATADISITGMASLTSKGYNYMKHDKYRWSYKLRIAYEKRRFWGIGYDNGLDDDCEEHEKGTGPCFRHMPKQLRFQFQPNFLFRLADNLYLGPQIDLNYISVFDEDGASDDYFLNQQKKIFTSGAGAVLQYDSRDVASCAYRGQFLRVMQMAYPDKVNKYPFYSTDITFSTYHRLWTKCVLAWEYHSLFSYGGDVPWTMMALVGTDNNRMRGYYEGRYRDRNIIETQLELRQSLPWRFGIVAFAGAANVFPDFKDINLRHTLPNYGVGLRWEFMPRGNLRVDLGFTKNKPGVVVTMNEAF